MYKDRYLGVVRRSNIDRMRYFVGFLRRNGVQGLIKLDVAQDMLESLQPYLAELTAAQVDIQANASFIWGAIALRKEQADVQ